MVDEQVPGPDEPEQGEQGQPSEPGDRKAPEPDSAAGAPRDTAADATAGTAADVAADATGAPAAAGTEAEAGDPEPAMTQVHLRRAPRYRAFVLTGALIGLIVAGVVVFGRFLPLHAGDDPGTVFLYFALAFVLFGGLIGAGAAILAERRR